VAQTTDTGGNTASGFSCPTVETACPTVIDYVTVARAGG